MQYRSMPCRAPNAASARVVASAQRPMGIDGLTGVRQSQIVTESPRQTGRVAILRAAACSSVRAECRCTRHDRPGQDRTLPCTLRVLPPQWARQERPTGCTAGDCCRCRCRFVLDRAWWMDVQLTDGASDEVTRQARQASSMGLGSGNPGKPGQKPGSSNSPLIPGAGSETPPLQPSNRGAPQRRAGKYWGREQRAALLLRCGTTTGLTETFSLAAPRRRGASLRASTERTCKQWKLGSLRWRPSDRRPALPCAPARLIWRARRHQRPASQPASRRAGAPMAECGYPD